jgi:RHS repeat-associated protein
LKNREAKDTTADATYTPQFFMPDVYSVQNYYAFGQNMPKWSGVAAVNDPKKYKFGFNGKEDDDEWGKQDYGFRIYDARVGRFLSVDPLSGEYPELTTYQFASNTPIQAIDLDGLEMKISTHVNPDNGKTVFVITLDADVIDMANSDACDGAIGSKCLKNVVFSDEVREGVEMRLSSTFNRDLDSEYIFEFGDIDFYNANEIDESTRTYKIQIGGVVTGLESLYADDYGEATIGNTQTNVLTIDLGLILKENPDANQQRNMFITVLAHEIGHSAGLRHAQNEGGDSADPQSNWQIDESNPETTENLMRGNGNVGHRLSETQLKSMVEQVKSDIQNNNEEN